MISTEQAKRFLREHTSPPPNNEDFRLLPERYQWLARAMTRHEHHRKVPEHAVQAYAAFRERNPWEGDDGQALAVLLFGAAQAPLVTAMWTLAAQLPFQRSYDRRPYRCREPEVQFRTAINYLRPLVQDRRLAGLPTLTDQLRYETYTEGRLDYSIAYAAALNQGGERADLVRELIYDILNGEDDIGGLTRSMVKALLLSKREQDWQTVGKLLLAAQRQEGLRQTILESADEASLGALAYLIDLIRDHQLERFSAVVRAVDTWFGFGWEAPQAATVRRVLDLTTAAFANENDARTALASEDNLEWYIRLWYVALKNVDKANLHARAMLDDPDRSKRVLAAYFMQTTGRTHLAMGDWITEHFGEDAELDARTIYLWPGQRKLSGELFERVRQRADALPKEGKKFSGTVFGWLTTEVLPERFYDFLLDYGSEAQLRQLGQDLRVLPLATRERYLRTLFPLHYIHSTYQLETRLTADNPLDLGEAPWKREVALRAVNDRSQSVMLTGLNVLAQTGLRTEDLPAVAALLGRRNKALRSALLLMLLHSGRTALTELLPKLLTDNKVARRTAGLELLAELNEREQFPGVVRTQLHLYRKQHDHPTQNETILLERLKPSAEESGEQAGFANGFGIIDYDALRPLWRPEPTFSKSRSLLDRLTGAAGAPYGKLVRPQKVRAAVAELVALIKQHADHEYTGYNYGPTPSTYLVGSAIVPTRPRTELAAPLDYFNALPLRDVWRGWYENCGLNDFELALLLATERRPRWCTHNKAFAAYAKPYVAGLDDIYLGETDAYGNLVLPTRSLLRHLFMAFGDHAAVNRFFLDVNEDMVARLPDDLRSVDTSGMVTAYGSSHWAAQLEIYLYRPLGYSGPDAESEIMLRYYDQRLYLATAQALNLKRPSSLAAVAVTDTPLPQNVVDAASVLELYRRECIGSHQLQFHFIKDVGLLSHLQQRLRRDDDPAGTVRRALDACAPLTEVMVDMELNRGELPTAGSEIVRQLDHVEGSNRLLTAVARLGKQTLHRGYSYYGTHSLKESLSGLIKKCVPEDDLDPQYLRTAARDMGIGRKRWLEVAMYAPQWAPHLAELLDLPGLTSAVWWFHAHAGDYDGRRTEATVARYTPIELSDLRQGAIAIDWFYEAYQEIGRKHWKQLHDACKYISQGNGHRQVKLYSSILLGETKITETVARIRDKRDQAYVKGLGLVPLSRRNPQGDLLKRYELLQQFLRERKQFGNQRQESEARAVRIGLDNLARTAGYTDTVRFGWVMEGKSTQAIMQEATATIENVTVELYLDELGKADLRIHRGDRPLKVIPTKLRKQPAFKRLREHKATLRKQLSRTRASLERAMTEATPFPAAELADVARHPIVGIMLAQLVLVAEDGQTGFYHVDDNRLYAADGSTYTPKAEEPLRIAHPYDLYRTVTWDQYQRAAFDRELRQPFKQIFRELYLLTDEERETARQSPRYAGHQVQPKKTVALLRGRGWTVGEYEGLQRVDHGRGMVATVYAAADWFSPAEVEAPTLEQVAFHDRKSYATVPLAQVDPLLFSETMRDLDLIVSVAHVGGVDPEASRSTLEMRAALARESVRLFKLDNVEIKTRYVIVDNELGKFQIHLGSGIVSKHQLQLHIIAVQSQHRGRVFLPFVDDDPKSAEIISKLRLLARPREIQDATVLRQLAR